MSITKEKLRKLRDEMQAALDKAGITDFELTVDGMRYGATDVTIKVKGKLKGVTSTSDELFQKKVKEYGLKLTGPKGEKLTGYNPRRPKYPFSFTTVRGARYKCGVAQAKEIFGQ